jgi:hypothetical protein
LRSSLIRPSSYAGALACWPSQWASNDFVFLGDSPRLPLQICKLFAGSVAFHGNHCIQVICTNTLAGKFYPESAALPEAGKGRFEPDSFFALFTNEP